MVSRVRVTAFRVSRVSAMVSVRFSGIWDRRLQVCQYSYLFSLLLHVTIS